MNAPFCGYYNSTAIATRTKNSSVCTTYQTHARYIINKQAGEEVMRILNWGSKPDPLPYVEGVGAVQMWLDAERTQEE